MLRYYHLDNEEFICRASKGPLCVQECHSALVFSDKKINTTSCTRPPLHHNDIPNHTSKFDNLSQLLTFKRVTSFTIVYDVYAVREYLLSLIT